MKTPLVACALLIGCVAPCFAATGPLLEEAPVAEVSAPPGTNTQARADSVVPVPELAVPEHRPDSDSGDEVPATVRPRRTLLERGGSTLAAFGSDAWYVVSSPARLKPTGLLWTAGILGAAAAIYANDQEILDAVVRNRDEPGFGTVVDIGTAIEPAGFMGRTNAIYAAATVAGYATGYEPLRQIPLEILESHLIGGGLRNIGKIVVGRRRPHAGLGPESYKWNDGTSFPSGHASVIFELATILSHHAHSRPFTVGAYALAVTLGIQRIEDRQHWPSDVFLASISGTLIARSVVRRNADRRALALSPWIDSDGRLLGVGVTRSF